MAMLPAVLWRYISVVVTYPTSNQGDVGSNPIRGNMFFFQNLFHIHVYMYLRDGFLHIFITYKYNTISLYPFRILKRC